MILYRFLPDFANFAFQLFKNFLLIRSDAFNLKTESFCFVWSLLTSLAGLSACYYKCLLL